MDPTTTWNELMSAEQALKPYEGVDLYGQTNKAVQEAYTPAAQGIAKTTEAMMKDYLSRFMNIPYQLGTPSTGTMVGASLTPQQQMSMMGNELGTMGGQLTGQAQLSSNLGINRQQTLQDALQSAMLQRQTLQDTYSRAWDRYSMAQQLAESAKSRAAAGGGGGYNIGGMPQFNTGDQKNQQFMSAYNYYKGKNDWEGAAKVLEDWGAYVSPTGWNTMPSQYKPDFEKWWAETQAGRFPTQTSQYTSGGGSGGMG